MNRNIFTHFNYFGLGIFYKFIHHTTKFYKSILFEGVNKLKRHKTIMLMCLRQLVNKTCANRS